jgi:hypothetical protein
MFRLNSSLTFYRDDHFPLHQAENKNKTKKQSLAISIILNKATGEMDESNSASSDIHIKTILIVEPSIFLNQVRDIQQMLISSFYCAYWFPYMFRLPDAIFRHADNLE